MNWEESDPLLTFQKNTICPFWGKGIYERNRMRSYPSTPSSRKSSGCLHLQRNLGNDSNKKFYKNLMVCTALSQKAVDFTGPASDLCFSLPEDLISMKRGMFSLSETRDTINCAFWSIPLTLSHSLCSQFLCYFVHNHILGLRFLMHTYHSEVAMRDEHFLVLLFHFGRFSTVQLSQLSLFLIIVCMVPPQGNRCQRNSLCS